MERSVTRRRIVRMSSGGIALGIAGCLGTDDSGSDEGDDDHENGTDTRNGTDTENDTDTWNDTDTGNGNGDSTDDEETADAPGSDGFAYAFAPDRIALVDPEAGEVVDELSIDGAEWKGTNVADEYDRLFALDTAREQVVVIDIDRREIVERVDIGPGGTHAFYPRSDEIWAHADDEGAFYVIDTDSLDVREVVDVGLDGEGHGKLLYHEDFGSNGYATNVNDPVAHIVDLENYERTGAVELGEDGGAHFNAYAPKNGLAYFERSGGVGTTAVVSVGTEELVDELPFAGGMYLTPDEERMSVIDGDEIHVLDVTTGDSEVIGTVEVEGGPDVLRYYEVDGTLYGFTANTMTPHAAVIDMDALEEVDRLDVGDIERPEGAQRLQRDGVAGGRFFFTPAGADGTVAVIDMAARELVAQVPVGDGVNRVQYV